MTHCVYGEILGTEMVIYFDYKVTYEGRAARVYGPPEDCHPAEPVEYDLTLVGIAEDNLGFSNHTEYLETPEWLKKIIMEYIYNSDKVYDIVCEDYREYNEYEYDEDYYRDR